MLTISSYPIMGPSMIPSQVVCLNPSMDRRHLKVCTGISSLVKVLGGPSQMSAWISAKAWTLRRWGVALPLVVRMSVCHTDQDFVTHD